MKLVDILALELKVWPEGMVRISQMTTGDIWGVLADGQFTCIGSATLADDFGMKPVTRAEWQAAVDALRAEEFVSALREGVNFPHSLGESFGNSILLIQQVGRAYRKQPEWSEDGLPNVGTRCVIYKGTWQIRETAEQFIGQVVTVAARFKTSTGTEMAAIDGGPDLGCEVFRADMCFHLPTAEEIAFREREDAITEMIAVAGMGSRKACTALYDRNYRKQVSK